MKTNLIIVILLAGIAGAQAQKQQPRTPNFNPSVRSAFKAPAGGQGNPRLSFGGNTNSRGSSAGLPNQGRVFPGGDRVVIPGGARQGLDVAARLREMENLRQRMPERLYDPGKFNTGGGRQPRPQDPREAGGYNPRSPELPAGVSRNQRSGFTDVRGARDRGTRGSSANRGDFNATTLGIFDDGVRMRFGAGSGFHSPHSEGHSADHQRGTTTIYEDFDGPMGPAGIP